MQNAEATRERILDAALAEFSAYGVAGARVDRIAKTAGCNKNLIYIYFVNKEMLFTTVLQRHLSRVYEDLPFTPEDLPGFAGRVFDFAVDHPDVLRLLAWSTLEQSTEAPPTRAATHDSKVEAIAAEQQAGRMTTRFSAAFLMTTVMALATSWSPAFPHGAALHPGAKLDNEKLRASVVQAVALLTAAD
jgi:AcrR family transcriptional regulator